MKRKIVTILFLIVVLISTGSCRAPRYYTRFKMKNHTYDQHYNPYRTKWYQWSYGHGVI